jgi:hypothetical protein
VDGTAAEAYLLPGHEHWILADLFAIRDGLERLGAPANDRQQLAARQSAVNQRWSPNSSRFIQLPGLGFRD